jgi:hypothetical protein
MAQYRDAVTTPITDLAEWVMGNPARWTQAGAPHLGWLSDLIAINEWSETFPYQPRHNPPSNPPATVLMWLYQATYLKYSGVIHIEGAGE